MIYTLIGIRENKIFLEISHGPPDINEAYGELKKEYPEKNILLLIKGDHLTKAYIPKTITQKQEMVAVL